MFIRLGHGLVVTALLAGFGGHWMLLQTVAWTNMLATNLRSDSFNTALSKTFDGRHPCDLCNQIAAAKKPEGKSEMPPVKKLEFVSTPDKWLCDPPTHYRLVPPLTTHLKNAFHPPLHPPPRSLPV